MKDNHSTAQDFVMTFAAAWNRVERRLDNSLGAIRGISLAEYRLLKALADAPGAMASRVDLANAVGLTPSAITRALRPMEKLGIVVTVRSKRDARLAIASLTPAGKELLADACGVVDDAVHSILQHSPGVTANREILCFALEELAGR